MENKNEISEMKIELNSALFEDFRIKLDRMLKQSSIKLLDRDDIDDIEVSTKIKICKKEVQLENGDYIVSPRIDYDIASKMSVTDKTGGMFQPGDKFEMVEEKGEVLVKRTINPQMSLEDVRK